MKQLFCIWCCCLSTAAFFFIPILLTSAKSIGEYEPSEVIRQPTSGKIIHLNGSVNSHTITITHDDGSGSDDATGDDDGEFCIEDDDEDCTEEDDIDEDESQSEDCDCDHGATNHTKDHRVINDVDERKTVHPVSFSIETRKNLSKW